MISSKQLLASLLLCITCVAAKSETTPVVAVLEFKNSRSWWKGGDGWSAAGSLSRALTETGSFRVSSREKIESIIQQNRLGAGDKIASGQALRVGKLIGAQYVIVGSVSDYSIDAGNGESGGFTIGSCRLGGTRALATMDIELKAVDVATGDIAYARPFYIQTRSTFVVISCKEFDVSQRNKDTIDKAFRKVAEEAADYFECFMVKKTRRCMHKYK